MPTSPPVDLSNCDREQIQYSGAVQPHAAFLALDTATANIIQAIANFDNLVPTPHQFLGQNVERLFSTGSLQLAANHPAEFLAARLHEIKESAPPIKLLRARIGNHERNLFAHRMNGHFLLELETDSPIPTPDREQLYQKLNTGIAQLNKLTSREQFLEHATHLVAELTGFERVMAYRFHEDGNGQVVAETVEPGLELYKGLHYPASDIPLPARRLFSLTWLRHLPNVDYVPLPIATTMGNPTEIDLSYALSRSVSVMYTDYLRNMGVKSTMVLTLLKREKLWGLISCMHHSAPRHIPYEVRSCCELLSHVISLLMANKEDEASLSYRQRLSDHLRGLTEKLLLHGEPETTLTTGPIHMLTGLDASGAAFVRAGRITSVGRVPPEADLRQIVTDLADQAIETGWSTDQLSRYSPAAAPLTDTAAGLLAARLSTTRQDYALWFRPEYRQTVNWAGDPNKPVEVNVVNGETRLSPRGSFATWSQEVKGRSAPWLDCEIEHATNLARAVMDIYLQRAQELAALNAELAQSNRELEAFAYAASHDLKEPLRGIHSYAQLLLRSLAQKVTGVESDRLQTILRLTRRMESLIESLLEISKLGKGELNRSSHAMSQLVSDALEHLSTRIAESHAVVQIVSDLPQSIDCDPVMVRVILQNLVGNAIKYNDKPTPTIEIGCHPGRIPTFFVRDNGIGIGKESHSVIFQVFRRLHAREEYGGGNGAGLTLARRAVERHGGKIWLESTPGIGSTFYFTLQPQVD